MQLLIGHGQVPTIMPEASKVLCLKERKKRHEKKRQGSNRFKPDF